MCGKVGGRPIALEIGKGDGSLNRAPNHDFAGQGHPNDATNGTRRSIKIGHSQIGGEEEKETEQGAPTGQDRMGANRQVRDLRAMEYEAGGEGAAQRDRGPESCGQ